MFYRTKRRRWGGKVKKRWFGCAYLVIPTLCDPIDYSPPGSSVHGIFQARILEQVAISFSRGYSCPGIKPVSLISPALTGGFFTTEPAGKPQKGDNLLQIFPCCNVEVPGPFCSFGMLLGCTYCRAYIPFENFNPTHFLKSGEESWVSVPFPQGMITTSSFSCGLRSSCKSMTIFWSGTLRAHLNPEFCQNRSLYTVCVIFFWALGARRNLWS